MKIELTSFYTTKEVCQHYGISYYALKEHLKEPTCKLKPIKISRTHTIYSGYTISENDGLLDKKLSIKPPQNDYIYDHNTYYTIPQVAKILRLPVAAIRRLIKRGLISPTITGRAMHRYRILGWAIAEYVGDSHYNPPGETP